MVKRLERTRVWLADLSAGRSTSVNSGAAPVVSELHQEAVVIGALGLVGRRQISTGSTPTPRTPSTAHASCSPRRPDCRGPQARRRLSRPGRPPSHHLRRRVEAIDGVIGEKLLDGCRVRPPRQDVAVEPALEVALGHWSIVRGSSERAEPNPFQPNAGCRTLTSSNEEDDRWLRTTPRSSTRRRWRSCWE